MYAPRLRQLVEAAPTLGEMGDARVRQLLDSGARQRLHAALEMLLRMELLANAAPGRRVGVSHVVVAPLGLEF